MKICRSVETSGFWWPEKHRRKMMKISMIFEIFDFSWCLLGSRSGWVLNILHKMNILGISTFHKEYIFANNIFSCESWRLIYTHEDIGIPLIFWKSHIFNATRTFVCIYRIPGLTVEYSNYKNINLQKIL